MVTIRRVAEGYAALLAGVLLGKLLALASEAVLGRNLGPAGLGSYGAAVAVMGYGLAVANLGLDVVGLRTASLAPASAGRLAARIRACRLTMSLVVASLGIAGAVLGRVDLNLALPLCLVAIALAFRDDWLLMALGHERQVAVASVIRDAAFLSMVAFFLPRTHAVVAAAWSYLVAEIVWSLYIQVMVRLSLRRAATPVAQMPLVRVWSDGLPIAVISILTLTTGRVGTAVVSWLGGPAEGGTYYAASRVLIACLALTAPIGRATLPQLAKGRNANGPAHGAAVLRLTAITSMLGCVMALVLFHNPGAVMRFLYGPAFTAGASVLRILAGCIFLTASYSIGLQQLLADGRQGTLLWVTAAAAIANLSVALLLARRFGAIGGAVGALSAELVLAVGITLSLSLKGKNWGQAITILWLGAAAVGGSLVSAASDPKGALLRLGLAAGATAVLSAPILLWVVAGGAPPSHTPATHGSSGVDVGRRD